MLNPEANKCVNTEQDVVLLPIERGYMLNMCKPPPPPHTHTRFLVITIKLDRNRNMILLNMEMLTLWGSRKMYKYVNRFKNILNTFIIGSSFLGILPEKMNYKLNFKPNSSLCSNFLIPVD